MTWKYDQGTGRLSHDGEMIATGYAGINTDTVNGLNNPAQQQTPFVGPIPRGTYTIGQPITNGGHMGPFVLELTPSPVNNMFGRSGFFIHGDKADPPPQSASNGCIIVNREWRAMIAQSGDNLLVVV